MCGEGSYFCLIYYIHSDNSVSVMKFPFETVVSEAGRDTEAVSVRQLPPEGEN